MSFITAAGGAFDDIAEGIRLAPMWWRLGLDSTVSRYRRTLFGPFWIASSTIAVGIALSIVFGTIFGGDWRRNFPFIMGGIVSFSFISGLVSDGAHTFINASGTMQTRRFPLSFHVFLMMDKAVINFVHQLVAFWAVMLILRFIPVPHWHLLITFPLVIGTGCMAAISLGMISVRFRDVNYFILAAMQALFTLTPVFWRREQIPVRLKWIVDYNPFAHLVEILRQPLMGHPAPAEDFAAAVLIFITSTILALACLALYRKRVVFWL